MKAIGYARVSTDEQTLQGVSLSHQEQKIRAYCIAKDFDAAVTNSALVVFDNADVKLDWLDDRLAIAATGGSIQKRVLYTDNKLADFPIRCFVGITSRTPEFRRDDVADRLLIMKVERFEVFVAERSILSEVIEHRNEIMFEVVSQIQEAVGGLGK